MKTLIKKCPVDGTYTVKGFCPKCNERTLVTDPPKFSPEDKYGSLRRKEKVSEKEDAEDSEDVKEDCGCN